MAPSRLRSPNVAHSNQDKRSFKCAENACWGISASENHQGHGICRTAMAVIVHVVQLSLRGARINRSAGDYGRTANHTKPQKDGPQT